jgi:Protein phosphatase 2C
VQIAAATEPTPGQVNEDFVITGPTWALVLDGATTRPDIDTGCIHDVPWFVRHLAIEFALLLTRSPDRALDHALADAIAATRRLHEDTCDLTNPDSPSATVATIRARDGKLDYLLLADSPLIIDQNGRVDAIIDDRTTHLSDYSVEGVRAARNNPNGFYVASTLPDAAYHAVHGSIHTTGLRRAALLSDGAARLVERFHLADWKQLLDLLATEGPEELIRRTRLAEQAETEAEQAERRGKKHDDATAVLVTHLSRL